MYLTVADVSMLPLTANVDISHWPQKVGEYLAAGRPVVSSDVGDTRQFIADSGAGYVVDGHSENIRQALEVLLRNPSLADEMGRRARQLAEERLAWKRLAAELELFYHQLIER